VDALTIQVYEDVHCPKHVHSAYIVFVAYDKMKSKFGLNDLFEGFTLTSIASKIGNETEKLTWSDYALYKRGIAVF